MPGSIETSGLRIHKPGNKLPLPTVHPMYNAPCFNPDWRSEQANCDGGGIVGCNLPSERRSVQKESPKGDLASEEKPARTVPVPDPGKALAVQRIRRGALCHTLCNKRWYHRYVLDRLI